MILRTKLNPENNMASFSPPMRSFIPLVLALMAISLLISCNPGNHKSRLENNTGPDGQLIIFHAGSLSVPFKEISRQFEEDNPGVRILLEASGSVDCARKITELKKPCDLMASSDYKVIEKFLIPMYTGWHIPFVSNEMVIAFNDGSRKAELITSENWPDFLLRKDVRYARSDPGSDPCGYRTVLVLDLAGKHYNLHDLSSKLQKKDTRYIRPKEVDLLALLEVGEIDYIFIYRSVAIQHHLNYIELPDEINLKDPDMANHYGAVSVNIPGNSPEDSVRIYGEPMIYSITMLNNAPNPAAATAFLKFLLEKEKGLKTMETMGQSPVVPSKSIYYKNVPDDLKKYLSD